MIKLFVGSDPAQHVAERALEASVRANTSEPVDITFMRAGDPYWDRDWDKTDWATPFTMFRWMVPGECEEGRAIYLDADMLALSDLGELVRWNLEGHWCAYPKRPDVIVWDCGNATELDARGLYKVAKHHRVRLPRQWDHCDKLEKDTKLLHFTCLRTQPWKPYPDRYPYDIPHPDPKAEATFWRFAQ